MTSMSMNEPQRRRVPNVVRGLLLALAVLAAVLVIWVVTGLSVGGGSEGEQHPSPVGTSP